MLNQYRYHVGQFSLSLATFKISGSDADSFLQQQSTFDINSLTDKSFHLASFLDPQGRIECYGWLCRSADEYFYLVPELIKDFTRERLNRYLISEDVIIEGGESESWLIIIGAESSNYKNTQSFVGEMFADMAILIKSNSLSEVPTLTKDEIALWRGLSGWPSFTGENFQKELVVNIHLFDLSVTLNKGCYPGQETVSKITTRRGAAYSPVLLEVSNELGPGPLFNFAKKIGESTKSLEWNGKYYLAASLLRDFRVEKMKLKFSLNNEEHVGVVRYYPLLSGNRHEKALELFHQASDSFKDDDLKRAEQRFREAIELDPKLADAYESLGVMLGRQERFQEALDWMDKLAQIDPTSVLAHSNKSLFLMRLGRIEEAEQEKSEAMIKSFAKFGEEAKVKEALESAKKQKTSEWEKRESMFKQVLEIDEEDTLANYGLGSIAAEREDWEKARFHLEKVINADPQYSVAYLTLGQTYKALGLFNEAKKVFTDGIAVAAKKGDLMPANQMQAELGDLIY